MNKKHEDIERNKREWLKYFNINREKYIRVDLTKDEVNSIMELSRTVANSKKDEYAYKEDGKGVIKRYFTGYAGEYAVVKLLNSAGLKKKYDFNQAVGSSFDFNIPDLVEYGFTVGCKTCGYQRTIKVKSCEEYPEIICVYDDTYRAQQYGGHVVYICGIAKPNILNQYSSTELIDEELIHNKDGKVTEKYGFNRFDRLEDFNVDNLMKYHNNLNVSWYKTINEEAKKELYNIATYIDYTEIDGEMRLILYNSSVNQNKSIITVINPYSEDGIKKLEKVLRADRLYIGFRIKTVIQWIQTYWGTKRLNIQCVDIWDLLYSDTRYKVVWSAIRRSEGMSYINLLNAGLINEIGNHLKKTNSNFAYMDMYLYISIIQRYKR